MSKPQKLIKRNGVYYFRTRVPLELVDVIGRKEIKISLETRDPQEARRKLNIQQVKADEMFERARRDSKRSQASASILKPETLTAVSRASIDRLVLLWHRSESERHALRDDLFLISAHPDEIDEFIQTLREDYTALSSDQPSVYARAVQSATVKVLSEGGIDVAQLKESNKDTLSYAELLVRQSIIQVSIDRLHRAGDGRPRHSFAFFAHQPIQPAPQTDKRVTWAETLAYFRDAKARDGMSPKTMDGYKLTFDFSTEVFGQSKPIQTITPADIRNLRDAMRKLPANARKRYPGKTLLETIQLHARQPDQHLSAVSVNGHLDNLSAIFNFAVREGFTERNPVSQIPKLKNAAAERVPFSENSLKRFFETELFKDSSAGHYPHPENHKYWIPLVALWTGMRLNEICQLSPADIRTIDNIPVIDVNANDDWKKLKTEQSNRVIPIHQTLIQLGFISYVTQVRSARCKLLFPNLTLSSAGSYSDNFSKWFGRFLTIQNIKVAGLCFHSFRHSFRDALRDAEVNREIGALLGGWKVSDEAMDAYGRGYKLEARHKAINTLTYPINLNRLFTE